jgi:hypothetical protein
MTNPRPCPAPNSRDLTIEEIGMFSPAEQYDILTNMRHLIPKKDGGFCDNLEIRLRLQFLRTELDSEDEKQGRFIYSYGTRTTSQLLAMTQRFILRINTSQILLNQLQNGLPLLITEK